MRNHIKQRGNELFLQDNSLITSKTDLRGFITYANLDFLQFSGYNEEELIGTNHNIIRHPLMPRVIFKILWDTIQSGQEINAFVINKNKQGLDYWVYANVTPSFDSHGNIIGYYSVRRKPHSNAISFIRDTYTTLTEIELQASKAGKKPMEESLAAFLKALESFKMSHQFFFTTLQKNGKL
ncbi:PAS domain-containing protein [Helicobacter sp. MIT 14-3879]|uniref:PAS domain-containing protein n=1 Tax=Helicobacter sp. MIT 14-3879 TaxID=2040649 RepID=UPI000E1EF848|nr:PAS domain-containing protein [Helicobacter sp. MIT 14-3879]RDU61462.1 histidine kinase [Helicobacter sp. MIT 14-3879]